MIARDSARASLGGSAAVVPLAAAHRRSQALDSELVGSSLGGDRLAQQLLFERHAQSVFLRVARLLGRSAEAEDVVQDAFLEAFRDLGQLQDRSRFGAWLMGVAMHQVHRRFRRRRLLSSLGLDRGTDDYALSSIVDDGADPELRTRLSELDRLLCRMPATWRMAWMLRHVEGCELQEVAQHCRSSLSSVKRHLHQAEAQVREEMEWNYGPEQDHEDR